MEGGEEHGGAQAPSRPGLLAGYHYDLAIALNILSIKLSDNHNICSSQSLGGL